MMTELILHFLSEILQMSKFNFFFSRDKFSGIAQIFLKFAKVITKFKDWKILLNIFRKIGTPFGRKSWTIGKPFGT